MRLELKRHRIAEKITWDKHVVAAGWLTWDAGSIPAASTIFLLVLCVFKTPLTKKLRQEANAFHMECRLLGILKDADYEAEYVLDKQCWPTERWIRITAGKCPNGYPECDEFLAVKPQYQRIMGAL